MFGEVLGETGGEMSSNFLGLDSADQESIDAADVVLFGVPSSVGAAKRAGAEDGPKQVRESSWTFGSYSHALGLDVLEEIAVVDGGDVDVTAVSARISDPQSSRDSSLDTVLERVQERVFELCRGGQIPGLVGGTQALSLGALRGVLQAKRRPATLVHLTSSYCMNAEGAGETAMVRRAEKEGLLRPSGVLQIGIRGPSHEAIELQTALRAGFERLTVDDVRWDIHGSMETVRKASIGSPIYLSVDLSALDPSICPGVTRPSPGGLSAWEVQQVLRSLVGADIVGFDVVGLCPKWDPSETTSITAVNIIHEILAVVADTRGGGRVSLVGGSSGRTSA